MLHVEPMRDLISVIIPAYNIDKYIEACVKSVMEQTYTHIEIIIVNDGSTDSTAEICNRLQQLDRRIRVIEQENQGLSAARNTGLEASLGEYITFIDGDDCIAADYLQCMYAIIKEKNAQAAVIDYAVVYENKKKTTKSHLVGEDGVFDGYEILRRMVIVNNNTYVRAWGKLFERSLWEELRFPVGKIHEDEFTLYQLWGECKKVAVVDKQAYLYIQRGDSIINKGFNKKRLHKIEAFRQRNAYFHERKFAELEECSRKQYLMQLQAGYCNITKFYPNDKELAGKLKEECIKEGREQKEILKRTCSFTEYVMIRLFFSIPPLYKALYFFYERYCKDR